MRTITLVIAAALAGCAGSRTVVPGAVPGGSRGDVAYQSLDADGERYRLGRQEDFRTGVVRPDSRVLPAYPAGWLERAPREVWICTELHVDAQGRVYGARPLRPPPCDSGDAALDAAFRAAVDAATVQWEFEPSLRCTLPPGARADGECRAAESVEAVPVSRAFRFVFRRTPQGGVVETGS